MRGNQRNSEKEPTYGSTHYFVRKDVNPYVSTSTVIERKEFKVVKLQE
jgi:hypothetical protein